MKEFNELFRRMLRASREKRTILISHDNVDKLLENLMNQESERFNRVRRLEKTLKRYRQRYTDLCRECDEDIINLEKDNRTYQRIIKEISLIVSSSQDESTARQVKKIIESIER